MQYIQWTDNYSVKVSEIDEQHKKLINMINKLHDAMLANKGREILHEIVAEMVQYVSYHFTTEEKYMRQFAYPDFEAHKLEHDQFAAEALELKSRLDRGVLVLTITPLTFLRDWLRNHILGTDMKYSGFFNANGLE